MVIKLEDVFAFGIAIAAIAGVVAMELMALHKGINGKRLATTAALVAGISGFAFGIGVG